VCLDIRPKLTKAGCPLIVYGTKNGNIGAVELTKDEAIVLWETDFTFEKKSGVSLIKVASLSPDEGPNHLIVTRDDGHIEVYTYSQNQAAEQVFECRDANEQITGVAAGYITSPKQPEIIYSCYSGQIKSICDRKNIRKLGLAMDEDQTQAQQSEPQQKKEKQKKIESLQEQVLDLEILKEEEEAKAESEIPNQKRF
jgi:hypothetical protein